MSGFYPAPSIPIKGDLGDVFHYFSKNGRSERELTSRLKQQQLQEGIDQSGRMGADPDRYLGAVNPTDFDILGKVFGLSTERQNADTRSGELKFKQDWKPAEEERMWEMLRQGGITADATALNAQTNQAQEQRAAAWMPDQSQLNWAQHDVARQNADANTTQATVLQDFAQTNSDLDWYRATESSKRAQSEALTSIIPYLPPEQAQALAKFVAGQNGGASLPAPEEDPIVKWMREKQAGKANAARNQAGAGATALANQAGASGTGNGAQKNLTDMSSGEVGAGIRNLLAGGVSDLVGYPAQVLTGISNDAKRVFNAGAGFVGSNTRLPLNSNPTVKDAVYNGLSTQPFSEPTMPNYAEGAQNQEQPSIPSTPQGANPNVVFMNVPGVGSIPVPVSEVRKFQQQQEQIFRQTNPLFQQ